MIPILPALLLAFAPADEAKAKVNFNDQVAGIFASRCNACHNADKAKGGLALETYAATIQGGGSGKVVEAGDLGGSHLWGVVTHAEEPKMPPNGPKIPDAELDLLKRWIEGGALETSGSVASVKEKPKFEFKLDPSAMGKPVGPPAMPDHVTTEPAVLTTRPNAIVALAASPWAPLVAVAGHKQVLLYHSETHRLIGVLPFPEGTIHVLKFSRNGSLLLAGGGRGGQSGLAVVFDVRTGKRAFEVGKEFDAVLAADISPDHGQVAIGGPSKVVRVYGTADGQLQFEMKKHTDWITALEFSPDGVLLATGDRNNGLIVWEAQTGREYFELRGHTATVADVSWRLDSNVLASASEDGTVRLWEMENGGPIKTWGAHGGGVASARFSKDGRIVTAGRDKLVRSWSQDGGKVRDFGPFADLALRATFDHDAARVIAGDWSGEVRVFEAKDGKPLASLAANPDPIARRLDRARARAESARLAADASARDLAPLVAALADRSGRRDQAARREGEAASDLAATAAALASAEKLDADRLAAATAATAAARAARGTAEAAGAERVAADGAIAATLLAEKAAEEARGAAQAAVGQALEAKVAQDQGVASAVEALRSAADQASTEEVAARLAQAVDRSGELIRAIAATGRKVAEAAGSSRRAHTAREAAPGLAEAAAARAGVAAEAARVAQGTADRALADRDQAAATLAEARRKHEAARQLADARKAEVAAALAELQSAEKALIEQRAPAEALAAGSAAAQAEVDALLADQKLAASLAAP